MHRTQLSAVTPGRSGPGRNGNEGVHCISQSSLITIRLFNVISRTLLLSGGVLPFCEDAVGVLCSLSRQGSQTKSLQNRKEHVVIVVRNGIGEMELKDTVCISLRANAVGKSMTRSVFPNSISVVNRPDFGSLSLVIR